MSVKAAKVSITDNHPGKSSTMSWTASYKVISVILLALRRLVLSLNYAPLPAANLILRNPHVFSHMALAVYNVPDTEIAALQDLYDATNGGSWNWHVPGNKWNFTDPNPCVDTWQAIICSQVASDGFLHVTELDLYEYNLVGTIAMSIVNLTQVANLTLSYNALYGTIPVSVGQLTALTALYLDSNQLTGTIPASLGQLTSLKVLHLGSNLLSGTIPESVKQLTRLTGLYLDNNQLQGTVPAALGLLPRLSLLDVDTNFLSGTIPGSFQQLTELTLLYMDSNQLTGTISASLCQLTQLRVLDLDDNLLSGTIPHAMQQLTQLTQLQLELNRLTGTVPSALCQLTQLTLLDVAANLLSGTIPQALQQLDQMSQLYLDSNKISGTIPSSLTTLLQLRVLQLGPNELTGPIPDSLSQLAVLEVLYLQLNRFTGTIPPSLANLARLRALSLGSNQLQGTLPQSWTAAATIQLLHLHENHLSGPVPESLGHMPLLLSLNLSSNCLTGTIPVSFQNLILLRVLMLQNNQLRGNIVELFRPSQANLSTVQLSNNQLTGSVPAAVFLLPSLTSFAAVDNCFVGPLPEDAICSSISLRDLVVDGLHSASSCKRSTSLSHNAFKLGPLPLCLLTMPSLVTLHLSGSGLTGSLPAGTNISYALTDLSLSHNLLMGEIPESILQRRWNKLDLSYNRLTGTLHSARVAHYDNSTELHLQHNRLSGVFPGSLQHVGTLSLLENNMFSCRVDRSDVPHRDSDSDKYICGSDGVNNSLYAWLGAAAALVVVVGGVVFQRQAMQRVRDWLATTLGEKAPALRNLINAAQVLAMLGTGMAVYCVLVLLPVYAAVNYYHPSFTHKYAWTVSGVYLTGTAAFVLEVVLWFLLLLICACAAERSLSSWDPPPRSSVASDAVIGGGPTRTHHVVTSVTVMISLAVVTGINVAFVIATLNLNGRELTVIQILLAVFKLGFNNVVAPALRSRVTALGVRHEITASQLLLVLLNVIVIPCLVVMIISPACFYTALHGPDSVTSNYKYGRSCPHYYVIVNGDVGQKTASCLNEETVLGTTTYTPPFMYSYQCSSSFITYYAPTFVIMCIISGFLVPAYNLSLLWLLRSLSPASRLYTMVTAVTPRILRELPSPQDLTQARSDPLYRPVFDAYKLMMSLLTLLALLLTFGALFPPLAVCCAVAMALVALTARLEVGRYVSAAVAAGRQDCLDEVESACAGVATPQQLRMALYLVLAVSCPFYTLFLFDTLGYEVGFAGAFWVLIVVPLLPVVAWALHTLAVRVRDGSAMTEPDKTENGTDPEVGIELPDMGAGSSASAEVKRGTNLNAEHQSRNVDTASANPMHAP
jgi:Leucine-rich repeat (LRR) protein